MRTSRPRPDRPEFGRRTLFRHGTAALAASAAARPVSAATSSVRARRAGDPVVVRATNAVVETTAGKIRGYTRDGIHTFKGVPYAASIAGAGRFSPPRPPEPWPGVRSTLHYGPVCPQPPNGGWANDETAFYFQWDDGKPGEDCLRINLWTPGLSDGRKRPILLWLHGGGYTSGCGQEHPGYDGENLSRRGDVVVASINHRLNVLGHLYLDALAPSLAGSGNLGMQDIVAALRWLREHAAAFGGDPDNVTVFGQSGGGGKVSTLMAMPSARGLFHKAIVMSGATLRQSTPEQADRLARAVLQRLQIGKGQLDRLAEVPIDALVGAGAAAVREVNERAASGTQRVRWAPVVDGGVLPIHPFDPEAPALSRDVPMLIGTTQHEHSPSAYHPELEAMTEADLEARARQRFGEHAPALLAACRRVYPDVKPVEALALISSVRSAAVTQAARKAAQGGAPAYLYLFCWKTSVLDGRPRATHCADIPFAFDNTDRSFGMTGATAEARALAARVSDAFLAFARTGDPNHRGLPPWPAFRADTVPTMCFDRICVVRNDHDRALREAEEAARKA